MRIAVCFSGHLRNFFTSDNGYNSLNKNILYLQKNGHQVDMFFSIWDTYDPVHSHHNADNIIIDSLKIDSTIFDSIDVKKLLIESYDDLKSQFTLSSITNETITSKNQIKGFEHRFASLAMSPDDILHCVPMYYKICSANKLKTEFELENEFTYDIVIRYRCHISLQSQINLPSAIEKNTIYLPYFNKNCTNKTCMADDRFAYGSSNSMNIYSNLYNELKTIIETCSHFGPERYLDYYLVKLKSLNLKNSVNVHTVRN
jgi:hypothetical protein